MNTSKTGFKGFRGFLGVFVGNVQPAGEKPQIEAARGEFWHFCAVATESAPVLLFDNSELVGPPGCAENYAARPAVKVRRLGQ